VAGRSNASQDAQDAWDAGDASLESGRNANGSDAGSVFADIAFFSLAGLQDSGMCTATGHDRDCRKAIALGFCI